jgi:signal transduction histidine kinase
MVALKPEELAAHDDETIRSRMTALLEAQPQIDEFFVVAHCSCVKDPYALFLRGEEFRRIHGSLTNEDPQTKLAVELFRNAQLMIPGEPTAQEAIFWQEACSTTPWADDHQMRSYVFEPLFSAQGGNQIGFAGFSLNPSFVRDRIFPEAFPGFLNGGASAVNPDLAIAVLNENRHPIYTSDTAQKRYEVEVPFSPVFPKWRLAIGVRNSSIESVAAGSFRNSLLISGIALAILGFGIALTLRATSRQVRLAQMKSAFVSNVSHELKTPLALIRLFAETLELGRVKSPEKANEYYRIISSESRRLTQLINNILDFAKIEAGRKEYQFTPCDVAALVDEVLQSYEYQIKGSGFELTKNIDRTLSPIPADPDAISQALLNLLNNAIKYSTDVRRIHLTVGARNGYVEIQVADQGIGIPASEHERVFEKFFRVSNGLVHDTKGSGLGLALVKHIVEAHGGRVLLESSPGAGSRFTMLIPSGETETATRHLSLEAGEYRVAEGIDN